MLCPVATILEFLQSLLDGGHAQSTLKVYVAAISLQHVRVENATVGVPQVGFSLSQWGSEARPPEGPKGPSMRSSPGDGGPFFSSL